VRKRFAALALIAACGGDAGLPPARSCQIARPALGLLHADGTRLADAMNRTIALRGVNAGGRAKTAPYAPFDFDPATSGDYDAKLAAYLDRAASWGIDAVRVTYSWQAAEPVEGTPDAQYLARFDALLDGAAARGLWTIVDFHQDVYAEPYCGDGFPSWTLTDPPAPHDDCPNWSVEYTGDTDVMHAFDAFWSDAGGVQTKYRAMWSALAARETGRAGVIGFEPINEPSQGTADLATWEQATLAPFYMSMAGELRAIGPQLVFVDTTGLEGTLGSTGLPDPHGDGIVLAPHSYDPRAAFGGPPSPDVTARLMPWATLGAQWNVPVVIGEMGIPVDNPFAALHLRRNLQALDTLPLAGATWWEYSVSAALWNAEHFSIVNPDGSETPLVAELARPYARALAGDTAVEAWDPDARRFTITYRPSADGAPTELAEPTRQAWRIGALGACVDEQAGVVLVQPDPGASEVSISIE
jgi:endoglycosylceramidase